MVPRPPRAAQTIGAEVVVRHSYCALLASATASHPRRSRSSGTFERYGLMSRIGVPSSMSMPRTRRTAPSRDSNSTTVNPIGFGRRGERVAKTPCCRSSLGGVTRSVYPSERSNAQMTYRREKPSMSVRPGSNSARISRSPSTSCFAHWRLRYHLAHRPQLPGGREGQPRSAATAFACGLWDALPRSGSTRPSRSRQSRNIMFNRV